MKLVVLGDPVAHSLSPVIQNAALRAAGVPGEYRTRRVDEAGVRQAIEELRSGDLDGANVTMPHKRIAAELCDMLDPQAERAAAVNTLVRVGDDVVGYNTDIAGVRDVWKTAGLPDFGPVMVLGAGGAAAAALLALESRELFVSARDIGKARALVDDLGVSADLIPWENPVIGASIVNATPLGMKGEELPGPVIKVCVALFDMTYRDSLTPALEEAKRREIPRADGEEMLLAQGIESFRLWTGIDPNRAAMRAALGEIQSSPEGAI